MRPSTASRQLLGAVPLVAVELEDLRRHVRTVTDPRPRPKRLALAPCASSSLASGTGRRRIRTGTAERSRLRGRGRRTAAADRPTGAAERDRRARRRSRDGDRSDVRVARADARTLAERLGATVFVPSPEEGDPIEGRRLFTAATSCRSGSRRSRGRKRTTWSSGRSRRALAVGDTLIDRGNGLELPADWLSKNVTARAGRRGAATAARAAVELVLPDARGADRPRRARARARLHRKVSLDLLGRADVHRPVVTERRTAKGKPIRIAPPAVRRAASSSVWRATAVRTAGTMSVSRNGFTR